MSVEDFIELLMQNNLLVKIETKTTILGSEYFVSLGEFDITEIFIPLTNKTTKVLKSKVEILKSKVKGFAIVNDYTIKIFI